jgi:Tubulin binding cofactor C
LIGKRRGKTYTSVVLSDVSDSNLIVEHPIGAAVHVTDCTRVTVHVASCQQMRLHGSTHVDCRIGAQVSAGAILEDCRGITFSAAPPAGTAAAAAIQVKDFGWLRRNVPSPNFRIVAANSATDPEQHCETSDSQSTGSLLPGTTSLMIESGGESDDEL